MAPPAISRKEDPRNIGVSTKSGIIVRIVALIADLLDKLPELLMLDVLLDQLEERA